MHLNFFEQGAPTPSTCMKCGDYRNLFDLGVDVWEGAALLCVKCIKEFAALVDYVDGAVSRETIANLTTELTAAKSAAENIPNQAEELINGIRNSVADFVLSISGSSNDSRSVPVQSDVDSPEATADNLKPAAGNGKASSKPASR
jgi:hypothetical protein